VPRLERRGLGDLHAVLEHAGRHLDLESERRVVALVLGIHRDLLEVARAEQEGAIRHEYPRARAVASGEPGVRQRIAVAVFDVLAEIIDVVHRRAGGHVVARDLLDLAVGGLELLHDAGARVTRLAVVEVADHARLREHRDPELLELVAVAGADATHVAEVKLAARGQVQERVAAIRLEVAGGERELVGEILRRRAGRRQRGQDREQDGDPSFQV
jgi:hypothetical protein